MPLRRTALSVTVLGLLLACSSSTAPKPTVAGTWHVALGALTSGSLSPASFDVVVPSSGSVVTMPGLTWSVGSVLFDSVPSIPVFSDTTVFGFGELERSIMLGQLGTSLIWDGLIQGTGFPLMRIAGVALALVGGVMVSRS